MLRAYYSDKISNFCQRSNEELLGKLAQANVFSLEQTQRDAWLEEIRILKHALEPFEGSIYFEYSIPRMGKRIDVVLIIASAIFVLEFKIGEKDFPSVAIDQVWDYALDLKNFHEASHDVHIAPVLIASNAKIRMAMIATASHNDKLFDPIRCNEELLQQVIFNVLQ